MEMSTFAPSYEISLLYKMMAWVYNWVEKSLGVKP